jgi:hypothetical protein
VAGLIDDILVGLRIGFLPVGEVTLAGGKRPRRGTEADVTYYLTNLDRLKGRDELVMGLDPAPDLTVVVAYSHPVRDTIKVLASFGVREVWLVRNHELRFLTLHENARYRASTASLCFPFLTTDELAPWVFDDLSSEAPLRRLFREWVDKVLATRFLRERPSGGGPAAEVG